MEEQQLVLVAEDEVMVSPGEEQHLAKFEVVLIELEEFDCDTASRDERDWHICHFFLWGDHVYLALMKAPLHVETSHVPGCW